MVDLSATPSYREIFKYYNPITWDSHLRLLEGYKWLPQTHKPALVVKTNLGRFFQFIGVAA